MRKDGTALLLLLLLFFIFDHLLGWRAGVDYLVVVISLHSGNSIIKKKRYSYLIDSRRWNCYDELASANMRNDVTSPPPGRV